MKILYQVKIIVKKDSKKCITLFHKAGLQMTEISMLKDIKTWSFSYVFTALNIETSFLWGPILF